MAVPYIAAGDRIRPTALRRGRPRP